jgi:hypothetical protein
MLYFTNNLVIADIIQFKRKVQFQFESHNQMEYYFLKIIFSSLYSIVVRDYYNRLLIVK